MFLGAKTLFAGGAVGLVFICMAIRQRGVAALAALRYGMTAAISVGVAALTGRGRVMPPSTQRGRTTRRRRGRDG